MASEVVMPRLSDSMEEGTVLKWLVEVGGEVKRGEPLVEIETDKANMTYESDSDGVLVEVLAEEGETLQVGEAIARVGEEGEARVDSRVDSRQTTVDRSRRRLSPSRKPSLRRKMSPRRGARQASARGGRAGQGFACCAADGRGAWC